MADKKVSDLPSLNGADVDPADLLYIVDSSAGAAGSKKITVGQYQLAPVSGGTANTVVYLNGSKVESSSSALTFDGTNLGVGTSSPAQKLHVNNTTGVNTYAAFSNSNATNGNYVGTAANGDGIIGTIDAKPLLFLTGAATRATLDSSGNLGLGVTPSASWFTGSKVLQFGTTGAIWNNGSNNTAISSNAVIGNSGSTYIANTAASYYAQTSGQHIFYTAPSGTAGNAITFTQAMTLDASGNLDIGTTGGVDRYQNIIATSARLTFNAGTGFTGSAATSIYNQSAIAMVFGTNNTERARITSAGDLLVGTTTLSAVGNSIFGSSVPGVIHQNNNAASNGFVFTSYRRSSVEIGSVSQNGTTAVLFNTTSDRRLKDNIAPAPSASDVIDAIEIVSHDWKAAPDEHVTYGVIAQDLALVAPQAVLQGDDGDEIEKTWGVDYSKLVPMLIKEIQSLRARVAALEAK